jgi:hypothetical protein
VSCVQERLAAVEEQLGESEARADEAAGAAAQRESELEQALRAQTAAEREEELLAQLTALRQDLARSKARRAPHHGV